MSAVATLGMVSCGGDDEEKEGGEEAKELSTCDCLKLAKKYDSEEDAREKLGDDKVDHCMEKMESASEEEMKECMGM